MMSGRKVKVNKDSIDFKCGYLCGSLVALYKMFPPDKLSITKEELDAAIRILKG